MGQGGIIYMWGQCRGQSITSPMATPLANIYDALACYGTPSVMHQPLILNNGEEIGILECMRNAFDDSVCIFVKHLLALYLVSVVYNNF